MGVTGVELTAKDLFQIAGLVIGFISTFAVIRYKVDELAKDINGLGAKIGSIDKKIDSFRIEVISNMSEAKVEMAEALKNLEIDMVRSTSTMSAELGQYRKSNDNEARK